MRELKNRQVRAVSDPDLDVGKFGRRFGAIEANQIVVVDRLQNLIDSLIGFPAVEQFAAGSCR
jgi:hypothetical protein